MFQKIGCVHVYQKSIQKGGRLNILAVKVSGLKKGWCKENLVNLLGLFFKKKSVLKGPVYSQTILFEVVKLKGKGVFVTIFVF